jgi:NAD(P)-dependent dehydrogenase (short-subunit alcohol dehydrogenase family)
MPSRQDDTSQLRAESHHEHCPRAPAAVAVVAGGPGGIGRAVYERLAAKGMSVLMRYASNLFRAEEVVKSIADNGCTAASAAAETEVELVIPLGLCRQVATRA